ncbi:hypothetical protein [Sphingopyxis alaskensis]|jgi:hypothetical protein|uniref:Uncharacterized protein n=1 Tax=Sphingopyxis alaskensis (strain DSM 13593 / LMG 18877 / RB2256) TaxID=317655 RepID=Q1GRB0_SPHAL|nr:hypothetical protein [Sphingopyxis alaskensis]ABF53812.1 hypothetical protein Sala_2103 [Sphingopyxis alaskensis RB2256]MCM3419493.1 hypothetical protein [Sphingopyxis alaskensis]
MTPADDTLAKKRFFAMTIMRLMGVAFIAIGFILISGGFALAGQPTDRWIGVAIVLIGAFDFAVMPLLLARRWRSPRDL